MIIHTCFQGTDFKVYLFFNGQQIIHLKEGIFNTLNTHSLHPITFYVHSSQLTNVQGREVLPEAANPTVGVRTLSPLLGCHGGKGNVWTLSASPRSPAQLLTGAGSLWLVSWEQEISVLCLLPSLSCAPDTGESLQAARGGRLRARRLTSVWLH